MSRNEAGAAVLALIIAVMPPASAQTPAPQTPQTPPASAPAPRPPPDPQSPNRAPHEASGDADARHCLDLATNADIIACAEKYRSHRARK